MTLTIASTGILAIDFASSDLLVKDTGGVLIKQGGSLAQTGRLSPPPSGGSAENLLVFHHADHLSGASVDTDATGTLLQLTDYYPFGDSRIEDTTTDYHNDYTYTGKERDEDTELLYYEARYYDSTLGRFLSLDPWKGDITDPQSLNKYAYVRNNPLRYTDPEGMTWYDPRSWDVNWREVGTGVGLMAAGGAEVAGSIALRRIPGAALFIRGTFAGGVGTFVSGLATFTKGLAGSNELEFDTSYPMIDATLPGADVSLMVLKGMRSQSQNSTQTINTAIDKQVYGPQADTSSTASRSISRTSISRTSKSNYSGSINIGSRKINTNKTLSKGDIKSIKKWAISRRKSSK